MSPDDPRTLRFFRDSRDAFGTRFQVEKPNRDWMWTLASVVLLAVAVVLMAGRL